LTEAKNASNVTQEESKPQENYIFLQGLKGKVINQCKSLSVEASGKGSAKKVISSWRSSKGRSRSNLRKDYDH
jgi:hypothetical protein